VRLTAVNDNAAVDGEVSLDLRILAAGDGAVQNPGVGLGVGESGDEAARPKSRAPRPSMRM
jgi:hypothetical protein